MKTASVSYRTLLSIRQGEERLFHAALSTGHDAVLGPQVLSGRTRRAGRTGISGLISRWYAAPKAPPHDVSYKPICKRSQALPKEKELNIQLQLQAMQGHAPESQLNASTRFLQQNQVRWRCSLFSLPWEWVCKLTSSSDMVGFHQSVPF